DGRDSEDAAIPPVADLALSRDIPVYSVLVGRDVQRSDAAIVAVPMQDDLLPGESGAILVKVFQSGLGGASTELRVRTGTSERKFPIAFHGKAVVELQVPVKHDEPGQHEYTLSLAAVPDEVTTTNNQTSVFCDVRRKRIRVLLV